MKRKIEQNLLEWLNKKERKPLVIFGARQIGKTYSIVQFAKEYFKDDYVYLDLQAQKDLHKFFKYNIDPAKIVQSLENYFEKRITERTLIIIDEIQECGRALTALKYFCDFTTKYLVIAAGSLLGVTIFRKKSSFPVGKIDRLEMYPLDFEEFLQSTNNSFLIQAINDHFYQNSPMDEVLHEKALSLYRTYLTIGGMPEVVKTFTVTNSVVEANKILENIYHDYLNDIEKYARVFEIAKIRNTYLSIPKQLINNNRNFRYASIETEDLKKRSGQYFETPIHWLITAKVIIKSSQLKHVDLPLIAHTNQQFRLFLSDVGLLRYLSGISISESCDPNYKDTMIGITAENYVAQELFAAGIDLYYWVGKGDAEIDFIIKNEFGIVPIEVKSGLRVVSASLKVYKELFHPKIIYRISQKNFGFHNDLKSIPLYAVFCLANQIKDYQTKI